MFVEVPAGLDEPLSWSIIKWIKANITISMGRIKCREKKRFNVGCETEKFPHNHSTNDFPRIGIAEKMFVITVAPQNDICPHGRTYPKKAVAITDIKIREPVVHTVDFVCGEEK